MTETDVPRRSVAGASIRYTCVGEKRRLMLLVAVLAGGAATALLIAYERQLLAAPPGPVRLRLLALSLIFGLGGALFIAAVLTAGCGLLLMRGVRRVLGGGFAHWLLVDILAGKTAPRLIPLAICYRAAWQYSVVLLVLLAVACTGYIYVYPPL